MNAHPQVLLVIPPGRPGTTPNREGASGLGAVEDGQQGFRYIPHGVASIAQGLLQLGLTVKVIDAPALGLTAEQVVASVVETRPQLLGVSVSWATRDADRDFLQGVKGAYAVPLVAFGISTVWMATHVGQADFVLQGEPQLAFPQLCDMILSGSPPALGVVTPHALGVEGYDQDGRLLNLDVVPRPAWHLLPLHAYNHLSLTTSQGCMAGCRWCPYVVAQGKRFRSRPAHAIVADLEEMVRVYHPQRIIVRDPAFAHDAERVKSICRGVIRSKSLQPGRQLKWECESRPEHLTRRLIRLMSLAGCIGIKVGLESTNAELLLREGRVHHQEEATAYLRQVERLGRDCADFGIALRLYAMVGLPGQTLEMVHNTYDFVLRTHPTSLSVKRYKRYPGLQREKASLPDSDQIERQIEVLSMAQELLSGCPRPVPARWRRGLRRLFARWA